MTDNVLPSDIKVYSVLPLRDIVVFPGMVVPLFVGREKSIHALEAASKSDSPVVLLTQKDATQDDPSPDDIFRFGVTANILQLLRLPDGTVKVLVEGKERVQVDYFIENDTHLEAEARMVQQEQGDQNEVEALSRSILKAFEQYVKLNKKIPSEIVDTLQQIEGPGKLVDTVAAHLMLRIPDKQKLLEIVDVSKRMEEVFTALEKESNVLGAEKKIRSRVRTQMEKSQKEYYLNEQIKAIQKELGETDGAQDEIRELEARIKKTKLSKEARQKAKQELKKLQQMSPMSGEATIVRNYLDWMLDIPWKKYTRVSNDLANAQAILDEDHYGLEKVKERIIEYLAVLQRTKSLKSQILCFVGPPGVGKTSLAKSIARATGRKFVRLSLGGVRDEAEIRGHRRTYVGALPGKIIQSMKKAGASNPLFLLDEIDKMGQDFRGDPASALLEVLDPEQNTAFNDHYMEVDYDLSDVMFITTANSLKMPRPLMDRMEIIRISGYTEEEKIHIATRHLIPKQCENHGLKEEEWSISEGALKSLIQHYTRESGVRNLDRQIAKLTRKATTDIVKKIAEKVSVTVTNLQKYAGVEMYQHNNADKDDCVGVTTGLAYTETGGDLLPIEAVTVPGRGKITLTGQLGNVMQESAQAAWSYIRSRAQDFGIKRDTYQKNDIHIHVPEGAIPKDGPSAGAAMCTTIVSALVKNAVRKDVAMTGEISLRGKVMPIGGLKEKLLAALRGEIKVVLIPQGNVKDLEEIPENAKKGLTIIPVSTVDEVLSHALVDVLTPIAWEGEAEEVPVANLSEEKTEGAITQH